LGGINLTAKSKFLLEISELSITYTSPPVKAVNKLSFELRNGENLGIIGESGCGKSTTALGIMGLIKDGSVNGSIIYKDINLVGLPENKMRQYRWKEIAMMFQNSLDILNPVLTIGEQVGEPLRFHYHLTQPEIDERVVHTLEMVGR
jgi:peptide/nickel transport system ATP-binding protein